MASLKSIVICFSLFFCLQIAMEAASIRTKVNSNDLSRHHLRYCLTLYSNSLFYCKKDIQQKEPSRPAGQHHNGFNIDQNECQQRATSHFEQCWKTALF